MVWPVKAAWLDPDDEIDELYELNNSIQLRHE